MESLLHQDKSQKNQGFTIVEIMVALVILAVGLLGMAGMTVVVMRGSRGANDLANATNVCQQKIEELKDVDFTNLGNVAAAGDTNDKNYGLQKAGMIQEVDLNAQGLTRQDYYTQQQDVSGSPCDTETGTTAPTGTSNACAVFLDQAGPYKYTRTFAICRGDDYDASANPPVPLFNSMKAWGGGSAPTYTSSSDQYSARPNCDFSTAANSTQRPQTLACESNDILTAGTDSPEKMIKILCTWRSKEGRCSFVNFEALRMNNL